MPKLTLTDIGNVLGNPNQAVLTINENFARIAEAFENTLSRDGTEPNQMEADLDLNANLLDNTTLGLDVVIVDA